MNELKFSKSRFDLQNRCLGTYYYKYVKKLPVKSISWPATIIGEAIHGYLEIIYQKIQEPEYNFIRDRVLKTLTYKSFIKKIDIQPFNEYFDDYLQSVKKDQSREFRVSRGWTQTEFTKSCDSWVWEIIKFLIKVFPFSVFSPEKEFSLKVGKLEINGVIDLIVQSEGKTYIIDFKTTKDSSKYYFVDWENDPQSLAYYYALKKEKIKVDSFSYFCFNMEDKTIVVNTINYDKDYSKNFTKILKQFEKNHDMSVDEKNWTPSKDNCRWCDFKQICKKAVK